MGNIAEAKKSHLYGTSAVNAYPKGVSPYGVWDLCGNVSEWTSTDYDELHKIIKGGCWSDNSYEVRPAFRNWTAPGVRFNFIGFRCVKLKNEEDEN